LGRLESDPLKYEGGEEGTIPPPLFKKGPEDNDGVDWSRVSDPDILVAGLLTGRAFVYYILPIKNLCVILI
jgi:hypothetical protein